VPAEQAVPDRSERQIDYVVGRDAGQLVMLRRFPQGLRDRLLMNTIGLKPEVFEANGNPVREPAAA
jgi:hypothetical protein